MNAWDAPGAGPFGFPFMAQVIPVGQRGDVTVEHLTITDHGGLHAQIHGAGTANGTYAILKIGRQVVMSDTDMERRSNMAILHHGIGDVLIGGLGLGMIVCSLLRKPGVRSVTVIENNPDVTALVLPALAEWTKGLGDNAAGWPDLTVIDGDVFTWKPAKGQKFDAIYFDVWADICGDNLDGINRLHRRAKSWKRNRDAFMSSWQVGELRRLERGGW